MRTFDESQIEMGMKEHPAGSKTLDVEAIENPKLVGMVEKRMANLNELTGRTPGKNPAALDYSDEDPTPEDLEDEELDEEEEKEEEVSAADSEEEEKPIPAKSKEKEKEGIPDAYIRAAVHNGWAEEDIGAFAKANPEVATKTFENLYNSTNKASREWAAIGRASRKEASKVQEPDKTDKLEYGSVDLAALKKEFDLDPAVERMIESSNARDKKLTDALNTLVEDKAKQPQDTSQVDRAARSYDVATEAAQEQQINNFFTTEPLKPYDKFYGSLRFGETWESLPAGQQRNRYAVYQTADQLLAGAAMQAHPMELPEALERAHLLVTEGLREEVIRSSIKKTATKRKNSMVFRPSEGKSKKGDSGGKPKKGELESRVAGLMKKAGLTRA